MSTIQNLKNFIRHGKQARTANSPHAEATTNVSNVHAQQQRYNNYTSPQPPQPQPHVTEPVGPSRQQQGPHAGAAGGFSEAPSNNQNQVARANEVAAKAAEKDQKIHEYDAAQQKLQQQAKDGQKQQQYDPSVIERIVAEERESKGKLPSYPGLERWILVEKMGDGAFSNVYRAKDSQGQYPEVAIKVVRKFEMNSSQVRGGFPPFNKISCPSFPFHLCDP